MFVKIHKTVKGWIRDDTGAYIGQDIPPGRYRDTLRVRYGDKLLLKKGTKIIVVYYGYFGEDGFFYNYCQKSGNDCPTCHHQTKAMFCPNTKNKTKLASGGYYIKSE